MIYSHVLFLFTKWEKYKILNFYSFQLFCVTQSWKTDRQLHPAALVPMANISYFTGRLVLKKTVISALASKLKMVLINKA